MPWVIEFDLRVTFEANRNCVFDPISPILVDVIRLHFDAAESIADATTALAFHKQVRYVVSVEFAGHGFDSAPFRS